MSLRRGFLIAMLVALALCAAMGVLVVFVGSSETMSRTLGTAIATAVASALLLGFSFLIAWPKFRLGVLTGMGVTLFAWLMVLAMIWTEDRGFGRPRMEELFAETLALSLFMGLPSAVALCFVSFRWAKVAVRLFVIGAVLSFLICEVGGLFEYLDFGYPVSEWPMFIGMFTYGLTAVIAGLAINAGCGDRRYFRWPAVALAVMGWALAAKAVVDTRESNHGLIGVMGASWIAAIVLAHTNIVLMARLRRGQLPVQWATIGLAWLCGLGGVIGLEEASGLFGPGLATQAEVAMRACAGTGIVAACGTLALVVLSVFNILLKSQRAEVGSKGPGAMQATAMEILCPRCQDRQTVNFGDSACKTCDLRFSIRVTEPRCPACGYLLYQLTSARCPECGADLQNGQTGPVVGPAFPVQPAAAAAGAQIS